MNTTAELLAEAIRFEHWARFHCMYEEANTQSAEEMQKKSPMEVLLDTSRAYIQIPDVLVETCAEEVPALVPLLNRIQGTEISLDSARDHILGFLQESLKLDQDEFAKEVESVSASANFNHFLDVFYTFVQEEADAEDDELEQKEKELSEEEFKEFVENKSVPTYLTWTETFKLWMQEKGLEYNLG